MRDERLLSVKEVAAQLGRSTEQVRRYLREGTLKGVQPYGQQWFVERDVLEMFQSRTRERKSFLAGLKPAAQVRPLDDVIGLGEGPGSNLGEGKEAYRRLAWWRR